VGLSGTIWDILHDGHLAGVERFEGNLRLRIGITYLCRHLPTRADHVQLELERCASFAYLPFEGSPVVELADIAARRLTILSAGATGTDWSIEVAGDGAGGRICASFDGARVLTAEGQPLSLDDLGRAANEYWTEWRRANGPSSGAGRGSPAP
jgi:hypothetical protein